MDFLRYQSLKRIGTVDTDGILDGEVLVFPKLDGTNASVWLDENGEIQAGSRNRHLDTTSDGDNAGFCKFVKSNTNLIRFMKSNPNIRLFGEFLIPHTLKTYRDDAWGKFYIFDVYNDATGMYVEYDNYKELLEQYNLDYIPCLFRMEYGNEEAIIKQLQKNTYLIKDGEGFGEGLVIKNYNYINKFGRVVWGKIVTNEFKEKNRNKFGEPSLKTQELVEEKIINDYATESFIEKETTKFMIDNEWQPKLIGVFLTQLWKVFLEEEMFNIVASMRYPTINTKKLHVLFIKKVKSVNKNIF